MFNNSKQKQKAKPNITFYILDDAFSVKHSIYTVLTNESVLRNMEANFYPIGEGILYEELFDNLHKNKADLYFLDTELEDGTGWDLVPLIKEKYPNAFIVMLSDGLNPSLNTKREQYEHMIFSTIEKPFQPGIVVGVLDDIISYQNSRKELAEDVSKENKKNKKTAADKLIATTFTPVTKSKKKKKTSSGFTIGEKLPETPQNNRGRFAENTQPTPNDSLISNEEKHQWSEISVFDFKEDDNNLSLKLDIELEDSSDDNSFVLFDDSNEPSILAQSEESSLSNSKYQSEENNSSTINVERYEDSHLAEVQLNLEKSVKDTKISGYNDEIINLESDFSIHLEDEVAIEHPHYHNNTNFNSIKHTDNTENNLENDGEIVFIDDFEVISSDFETKNDDFKVNYDGNGSVFDYNNIRNEFSETISDVIKPLNTNENSNKTTNDVKELVFDDFDDYCSVNKVINEELLVNDEFVLIENDGEKQENSVFFDKNSVFEAENKENSHFSHDFTQMSNNHHNDTLNFSNDEDEAFFFFEDDEQTSTQEKSFTLYESSEEAIPFELEEESNQDDDFLIFDFDDNESDTSLSLIDDKDELYSFEDEESEKTKTPSTENFDLDFDLLENEGEDNQYKIQDESNEALFFLEEEEDKYLLNHNEKISQADNFEYSEIAHPYSERMNSEQLSEFSFSLEDEPKYTTTDWDTSDEVVAQSEGFYLIDDETDDLEFEDDTEDEDEFYIRPPMKGW